MYVKIWGTRGSFSVNSLNFARYGGNTTCLQVESDESIILDAGTGIRNLGEELMESSKSKKCTILLTHGHRDHVQGFTFFAPLFNPDWDITIMAHERVGNGNLQKILEQRFDGDSFPVLYKDLACKIKLVNFKDDAQFYIGKTKIETINTNHPNGCVAYKVSSEDWVFLFTGDHELDPSEEKFTSFVKNVDTAVVDAQYNATNYNKYKNFGHSSKEDWCCYAAKNGIKNLIISHFDPSDTDNSLDFALNKLRSDYNNVQTRIDFAKEGLILTKEGKKESSLTNINLDLPCVLCDFSSEISGYSDINTILDSILTEARHLTNADAGTIYLVEEEQLVFSYTQNDTLFKGQQSNKQLYFNSKIPISPDSISGYVAYSGKPLHIGNVYQLDKNLSYSFNDAFDRSTNYKTVSMLTLPFIGKENRMLGVIQLINCIEDGKPIPFPKLAQHRVERLACLASDSIERTLASREMILRMQQIAALRDPLETTGHVLRVGTYVAELYQKWAEKKSFAPEIIKRYKDELRMAAMLHDVGKVGIPDKILKKPGKLDPEERKTMETHSALGAQLFNSNKNGLEKLSQEIALHHHQRWDGKGYTGEENGILLAGEDIPVSARLTSVADVFDALTSQRCYKDAWPMDDTLALLKENAGTQFDPEIIECFMEIFDVLLAIKERYK